MLYYPLSSKEFTFENIFSTESISPPAFYSVRNYGIGYFNVLTNVNLNNAIVLYNAPPLYNVENGIKFLLQIDERSLDMDGLVFLDEGVFGYTKTIYLRKDNFMILFFSEKDFKISVLKSKTSLPTKNLEKYFKNFEVISDSMCQPFNIELFEIKRSHINIEHYTTEDKKFNNFKGLVYGIATGLYDKSNQDGIPIKKALRELTNLFAEFKSRISDYRSSSKNYSKYKNESRLESSTNLINAIDSLEQQFHKIFSPQDLSKAELITLLYENYTNVESIEEADRYVKNILIDDEIHGKNVYKELKKIMLNKLGAINNFTLIDELRSQILLFVESTTNVTFQNLEEQNSNIKVTLHKIENYFSEALHKEGNTTDLSLDKIKYNFKNNEIHIMDNFHGLANEEIKDIIVINNTILHYVLHGKESGKQLVLRIVEDAGKHFSRSSKQTNLYQYLNNQINEYSLDKVANPVLRNFVAFIFNFESIEKLENFIMSKNIQESWIAYSFWGAFNGFANLSGNFTKTIFSNDSELMQNYLDEYLKSYLDILTDFNPEDSQINYVQKEREVYLSSSQIADAIDNFYQKFIAGRYKLTKDEFSSVYSLKDKDKFYKEVKARFKMNKKTAEKLFNSMKSDFTSPSLFI